jgi:DNA-binding response OmpR family regulator
VSAETDAADSERPVVLAVDDEPRITQSFDIWLDGYEVLTAMSGEEALSEVSDRVDVVLLDRHMPGMSGDEVLERIRERDVSPRVAMITGVEPDFDIVDMPFDDYVEKPVGPEVVADTVDELLDRTTYDERIGELETVAGKIALLEDTYTDAELEDHETFTELVERRDRLQQEADELLADLDPGEFEQIMSDF